MVCSQTQQGMLGNVVKNQSWFHRPPATTDPGSVGLWGCWVWIIRPRALAASYLFCCGRLRLVDGAAAGVAGGVVHHGVRSAHRVVHVAHAAASRVTARRQVLLQGGAAGGRGQSEEEQLVSISSRTEAAHLFRRRSLAGRS